jgi:acetoin utilization protein AcuB
VEIARVMSTPPIVITPGATIEQAAAVMAAKRIGCLPVLEDDDLVGMVTETDILRWVARDAR